MIPPYPSSPPTRRAFLQTTSLAMAGTIVAPSRYFASQLPSAVVAVGKSANDVLPPGVAPDDYRLLAQHAVDAAAQVGATYADIRVGERHELWVLSWGIGGDPRLQLRSTVSYGVRALVNGAWAFVHGSVPTVDAVTTSARHAVALAKGYAKVSSPNVSPQSEWLSLPAATGEWRTPIHEDPFTVPLRDHAALLSAYQQAVFGRVRYARVDTAVMWTKELRIFASSEGALTTQTWHQAEPHLRTAAIIPTLGWFELPFPPAVSMSGGLEVIADPMRQEAMKAWAEELHRIILLPRGTLDVGRYPVVFDGRTTGMVLGRTLWPALELDRVLGAETDASGTSFLSPPADVLGQLITSPAVNITGHRALLSTSAVKWDDEGVEAHAYPVITEGRVVDYHTSRATASALQTWYAKRGRPVVSHGCMTAPTADAPVLLRAPHLTVQPATSTAGLDVLCKDISHGLLFLGADVYSLESDHALTSISLGGEGRPGVILEIVQGTPVRRIQANGIEAATKDFWKKQLVTLGDASTVQDATFPVQKGMPWQAVTQGTTAPAALFKDVNVVSYRRGH